MLLVNTISVHESLFVQTSDFMVEYLRYMCYYKRTYEQKSNGKTKISVSHDSGFESEAWKHPHPRGCKKSTGLLRNKFRSTPHGRPKREGVSWKYPRFIPFCL